jgi:hypothetical protein
MSEIVGKKRVTFDQVKADILKNYSSKYFVSKGDAAAIGRHM